MDKFRDQIDSKSLKSMKHIQLKLGAYSSGLPYVSDQEPNFPIQTMAKQRPMIYKEDCRTIQELVDRVDRVDRRVLVSDMRRRMTPPDTDTCDYT